MKVRLYKRIQPVKDGAVLLLTVPTRPASETLVLVPVILTVVRKGHSRISGHTPDMKATGARQLMPLLNQ
jgi:hypothetical protein